MARPKKDTKEIKEIFSTNDKIKAVMAEINKKLSTGKIKMADEFEGTALLRRPFDIPTLDCALKGGLPRGFNMLVGEKNSGKTFLMNKAIAACQQIYGESANIAYIVKEPLDKEFAKNIGVKIPFTSAEIAKYNLICNKNHKRDLNTEELSYLKEKVGNIVIVACSSGEESLQAVLDLTASNEFQIIGLDSLATLESEQETEKDMGEQSRAQLATMLSQFQKKFYSIESDTTIIALNQIREKQNTTNPYERKWIIPGGKAKDHLSFATIYLSSGEKIKEKISGKDIPVGKYINFLFEKGKFGIHEGITGAFNFYFGENGFNFGVDKYQDLTELAASLNIVQIERGPTINYENQELKDIKFYQYLKDNPQVYTELLQKCFIKSNVKCLYKYE